MTPLQQAAHAIIARWESPDWKDEAPTAVVIGSLLKALTDEQAQAVEPATGERAKVGSSNLPLRVAHAANNVLHEEVAILKAALEKAQQVALPTWKAEQIDEYEIRVTSPEGESWRLRSADRNDSFNNFIWRWAESLVNKGQV